jgi:hypothetical protein
MNCAYCGKEIKHDQYQGSSGWDFKTVVGGIPVTVEFHYDCLNKFIGESLTKRMRMFKEE